MTDMHVMGVDKVRIEKLGSDFVRINSAIFRISSVIGIFFQDCGGAVDLIVMQTDNKSINPMSLDMSVDMNQYPNAQFEEISNKYNDKLQLIKEALIDDWRDIIKEL